MPLPLPVTRRKAHARTISYEGYRRDDGLWDIDAALLDVKGHTTRNYELGEIPAGTPIHAMRIRATVDDTMKIIELFSVMEQTPYRMCQNASDPMRGLIGVTLGPGWRAAITREIGGTAGCTHLRELLFGLATAAYQTIPEFTLPPPNAVTDSEDASVQPPFHLGKCFTWDFDGEVVRNAYPQFAGWRPLNKR
jgi:hypothetical protein